MKTNVRHAVAMILSAAIGVVSTPARTGYSAGEEPARDLRFDPVSVHPQGSFAATFFGPDYSQSTNFDLRFRRPDSVVDEIAMNWQRGNSVSHAVPAGTAPGIWLVTGVRAHEDPNDHTGEFIPVTALLSIAAMSEVFTPTRGAFMPTGNMSVSREQHTATLLSDGRVLITGGFDATRTELASAELYDPSTGSFSPTGSMAYARASHTANLLKDGRVLIVGGRSNRNVPMGEVEIYDPARGVFEPIGRLITPQSGHASALLADGRVLVIGGNRAVRQSAITAPPEIFDPKAGSSTAVGIAGDVGSSATLLHDGRVLVAGGWLTTGAELFDPIAGAFRSSKAVSTFGSGRYWHTTTLLQNGKVLVVGGAYEYDGAIAVPNAEIYDPETDTFIATTAIEARANHTATLLSGSRILIAGGYTDDGPYTGGSVLRTAAIYDVTTGEFQSTGSMISARDLHTSTLLADGTVLVVGGRNWAVGALNTAEIFFPPR